jgi:hypothetical protein
MIGSVDDLMNLRASSKLDDLFPAIIAHYIGRGLDAVPGADTAAVETATGQAVLCELVPAVICSGFGKTEGGDVQPILEAMARKIQQLEAKAVGQAAEKAELKAEMEAMAQHSFGLETGLQPAAEGADEAKTGMYDLDMNEGAAMVQDY